MSSIAFRKIPDWETKKIEEEEKERQKRLKESFLIFDEDGELDFKAMRKAGYTQKQILVEYCRIESFETEIISQLKNNFEKNFDFKDTLNHSTFSPEIETKEEILPIKQKAVIAVVFLLAFFLFSTGIYFANVNRIKESNTEQTNKNFIDINTGFNNGEYQKKKYLKLKIDRSIEKYLSIKGIKKN